MRTFQRLFSSWLNSSGLGLNRAAQRLGVCERTAHLYATGKTVPPNVRVPLLAERMGLDARKVLDAVMADRTARARKALQPIGTAP